MDAEQIKQIRRIVNEELESNYYSGYPSVPPHTHNGTDNLNINGDLYSLNFKTGVYGWQLTSAGNLEANNGIFRGTFSIAGTTKTIDNTQNIQIALDSIYTAGGGVLYLNAGTYTLTSDISIPSGVSIIGISVNNCIIDCNTSYKVKMEGTNVYSTGTVTINNSSTAVVGSSTVWTSAMIGRSILLGDNWYEIVTRTDNTHITIANKYTGANLVGASYFIATINIGSGLYKVSITNATAEGLKIQYALEPVINNIFVTGCGTGLNFDQVVFPLLAFTSNENGVNVDFNNVYGFEISFSDISFSTTGAGFVILNSGNATFFDSSLSGNFGNGMTVTGCNDMALISVNSKDNGAKGIEFVSSNNDCQLIAFTAVNNISDGIKLTATSDRISISNSSILTNGGYGINIAAATCDNNSVVVPLYNGNVSGTLSNSGTGTIII